MDKAANGRNQARDLVRALPPAEQQYQRHLLTIGERRRDLAALERDLVNLRDAVTGFEALAQSRLGELFVELRRLERENADYGHRLERLRAALDARSLEELDLDDVDLEDLDLPPLDATGARRAHRPHMPAATRRWLANEAAEAKRLYIDLAKRLHPDLARTDEDRQSRERIMQRINEAFRQRDLGALRSLHHESLVDDPSWIERSVRERLAWSESELQRLDIALEEVKVSLSRLRAGELFRLYTRYEAGEPVFTDLRARLEERIRVEGRRLERMKINYARLVDQWRKSTAAAS
ncbi:MAG: hypothetical protein U0031_14405 [Thermomicrobiales bacterium]